jgi:hypothetical protein
MALLMWAEVWRQDKVELSGKRPHLLFLYQAGGKCRIYFMLQVKKNRVGS